MSKSSDRSFLLLVTLLSSISLFATDIYLPALPEMAKYFNCSHGQIQMSFTFFLIGQAICHLASGLLTDRFGSKPILLFGLATFTLASALCAFATSLPQFILCRLGQAVGGGCGSVISRTLVVNRFDRVGSVKAFSTIFPVASIMGAIAPFIGGYLIYLWNWQTTFIFVSLVGLGLFVSVYLLTEDQTAQVAKAQVESRKYHSYFEVLSNLEFVCYVLIIGSCFSAFRSYIVESPFVFTNQGYSVQEIGRFYLIPSVTYIAGNLVAKKLIHSQTLSLVLGRGIFFFGLGSFCLLAAAFLLGHSPYPLILAMSILTMGNGFLFPVGHAGAMTAAPTRLAGTASGIVGASGFITAAFCITWVGPLCGGDPLKLALFIGVTALLGLASYGVIRSQFNKTEVVSH